jgi:hypothetical protein
VGFVALIAALLAFIAGFALAAGGAESHEAVAAAFGVALAAASVGIVSARKQTWLVVGNSIAAVVSALGLFAIYLAARGN